MSAVQMFPIGDSEVFEDYYVADVQREGIDRVWYIYHTAPYEGSGCAVFERDGRFNEANLGHCSCYGPWDRSIPNRESDVDSLDALQAKCSREYYADELKPCFDAARAALAESA